MACALRLAQLIDQHNSNNPDFKDTIPDQISRVAQAGIRGIEFHEKIFIDDNYVRDPARVGEIKSSLLANDVAWSQVLQAISERLTPETIDVLLDHEWDGNVREMVNVMEYANIISGGGPILPDHLPQHIRSGGGSETISLAEHVATSGTPSVAGSRTLKEVEIEHILHVVEKNNGKKQAAAEELGISLKTLYNKLNALEEERRSAG